MFNMGQDRHEIEYPDEFVTGLEWMWGEGFMSPGGAEEVGALLSGVDLSGKTVLDIGCGVGGVDLVLVRDYGVGQVIGIDIEAQLIEQARARVQAAGLAEQIDCRLVEPGALPFTEASLDVVFSKDSMIHIPDKAAAYAEIFRVLKPGGQMIVSDWFGSDQPETPEFKEWLIIVHLNFAMGTLKAAAQLLADTGFETIRTRDRNTWYGENIKQELAMLQGDNYDRLAAKMSPDFAAQRLKSSQMKRVVVEQGLLRPGHLHAVKPEASSNKL